MRLVLVLQLGGWDLGSRGTVLRPMPSREHDKCKTRRKMSGSREHRHQPCAVGSRSFSTKKSFLVILGALHLTQAQNLCRCCDRPHTAHMLHWIRASLSHLTCLDRHMRKWLLREVPTSPALFHKEACCTLGRAGMHAQ